MLMQEYFLKIVVDIFNKWIKNWNSDYLFLDCYV